MVITMEVKSALAAKKAAGRVTSRNVSPSSGSAVGDWGSSITSRLNGLVMPFIDFTFRRRCNRAFSRVDSIHIARQYDGLADTPQFLTNPMALVNSLLGALFVHGLYANAVSLDENSPNYVPGTKEGRGR